MIGSNTSELTVVGFWDTRDSTVAELDAGEKGLPSFVARGIDDFNGERAGETGSAFGGNTIGIESGVRISGSGNG